MKTLEFKDYVHLSEYIYELVAEQKNEVSVIMLKNSISALIKELIQYDVFSYGRIDFSECGNYNKEYYLIVNSDYSIDIFPAYHAENIILIQSRICLFEDANSHLLSLNDNCNQYQIFIKDKCKYICDDCCYDCNSCPKKEK